MLGMAKVVVSNALGTASSNGDELRIHNRTTQIRVSMAGQLPVVRKLHVPA